MEKITYKEAAEILDVEYITIKHAAMRGKLTRCSIPLNQAMLLKQQVELFKGKRGISVNKLTIEEKSLWDEYKRIAEDQELLALALNPNSHTESLAMRMAKEAGKSSAQAVLTKIEEILKSFAAENNLKIPVIIDQIKEATNP